MTVLMTFMLLLTGCGARISTHLMIEDNLSGQRIITCVVDKSDVQQYFIAGIEKIDNILATHCPEEMTYVKAEDEMTYTYTFTLSFASIEDYKVKVEKIIGSPVNITVEQPNTVFANGLAIQEDFISTDLLNWFKVIVQEESLVTDISNLWEVKETVVSFKGQEYTCSYNVDIDRIEYTPLSKITIYTELQEDGTILKKTTFMLPMSTYEKNADAIEAYMEERVPDGAEADWSFEDYDVEFTVAFEAQTIDEIPEMMQQVLDTEAYDVSILESEGEKPLNQYITFNEQLDFNAFCAGIYNDVFIEYALQVTPPQNVVKAMTEYGDYHINQDYMANNFTVSELDMSVLIEKPITIDHVSTFTKVISEEEIQKQIAMTYGAEVDEIAASKGKTYFESFGLENLTVDLNADANGIYECLLTIKGNPEEVSTTLSHLLMTENNINYVVEDESFTKKRNSFYESIDLQYLFEDINYYDMVEYKFELPDDIKGEQLTYNDYTTGTDEYIEGDSAKEVGSVYERNIHAYGCITYTGTSTHIVGVLIIIGIVLLVIVGLGIGIIFLTKKKGFANGKETIVYYTKHSIASMKQFAEDHQLYERGQSFGQALKAFILNLGNICLPKNARYTVVSYFYASKWPLVLTILLIIRVPQRIALWIAKIYETVTDGYGVSYFILPKVAFWGTLVAIIVIYLVQRFGTSAKKEAAIDAYLTSDLQNFRARALEKLGIIEEQVNMIDPIEVVGPAYKHKAQNKGFLYAIWQFIKRQFVYEPVLVFKSGADEKVRYSIVQAHIFFFSERQIYVYEASYDLCTGEIFSESTSEYFYENVSCIIAGEETQKVYFKKQLIDKQYEYFKVITRSGTYSHAVVEEGSSILRNQIQGMKNLVRDKKEAMK